MLRSAQLFPGTDVIRSKIMINTNPGNEELSSEATDNKLMWVFVTLSRLKNGSPLSWDNFLADLIADEAVVDYQ